MRIILLTLVLSTFASSAKAAWIYTTGKITSVQAYIKTDTVLVKLDVSGTPVPECSNTRTFAIDGDVVADRRKQMLSLLLAAKATEQSVSIAYNDSNGCVAWDSRQNVFRSITRVSH